MTDHSTPQNDADAADPTRQKLESLFKLLRGSDGPTPGDSNSVSQRFRLLRRHASGGLGDIWIAHDEELNREVALKEIQTKFASNEQSWSRFLREATITGQLEHPGIVPIYALGHHENGQPFYAMRFVQGDTLADSIAKFHRRDDAAPPPTTRNLQRRQLITRLIDVCNAVAYAHSRSIIHRDLKPANIMLGEFGETLVVDWGLAKSLAEFADETQPPVAESLRDSDDPSCGATRLRETPPTQIGSAIGSPPYMSPEQAAGRLEELGPASDIYSLGATLFELLTGQSPIGAAPAAEPRETLSIKDLLQRIQEGRFQRPSTVTPDVPRALEAVCLKAMSLRPEDRYASARDLASDLEAWLADEPVTAWTEPLTNRTRRWMRRHQTAVVSTSATALVAIVALSVLAFVVTDRNERLATAKGNLERSNNQLNESNRKLKASNKRESDARQLAEANARTASEQSWLAFESLGNVVFRFQDDLRWIGAAQEPRKQQLIFALDRLKGVSGPQERMRKVEKWRISAMLDLALISENEYQPFGDASTNKRVLDNAEFLYEQAMDSANRFSESAPDDGEVSHSHVSACLGLSRVHLVRGKFDVARDTIQFALAACERRGAESSDDATTLSDLAACRNSLGDVAFGMRDYAGAITEFQRSLEIRTKVAALDADARRTSIALQGISQLHRSIGNSHSLLGKVDAAINSYEQALKPLEQLASTASGSPIDPLERRGREALHQKLGEHFARQGNMKAALDSYLKAMELDEVLAAAVPGDIRAMETLSWANDRVGDIHKEMRNFNEARHFYLKNLEFRERQANVFTRDGFAQRMAVSSYIRLGDLELQMGNIAAAEAYFQKMLSVSQRLSDSTPKDAGAWSDLILSFTKLGLVSEAEFAFEEAADWFQKVIDTQQKLERDGLLKGDLRMEFWKNDAQFRVHQFRLSVFAIEPWDRVLAQPEEQLPEILTLRCSIMARKGQIADVAQSARKLRELKPEPKAGQNLYNAACGFSLCASCLTNGKTELSDEDKTERERYVRLALECLREAIAAGFNDFKHIQKDSDLAPLRDLPEFLKLIPMTPDDVQSVKPNSEK